MSNRLPFVGRVVETTRCQRYLEKSLGARESAKILVTGERGVGKTRFIEEMLPRARARGFDIVTHRCQKWDRHSPFSVIAALLRSLLGKPPQWSPRNIETFEKLVSDNFPGVSLDSSDGEVLCWMLGSPGAGELAKRMDEKSRRAIAASAFDAFVASCIQRDNYLLLVLDDIYHGDEFSVGYILTSFFPRGVVFVLSTVSEDLLPMKIEGQRIVLKPLDEEKVQNLLEKHFGKNFPAYRYAAAVARLTGGNALHIAQLLLRVELGAGAARALANALRKAQTGGPVDASRRSLESLDRFSARLVQAASLIAESFPLPILKYMVGRRFPVTAALRSLRRAGIAIAAKEGGKEFFRFRHGIIREAAYSMLTEVEKSELHAAAADAIRRYYGRANERYLIQAAHHYEEAGDRSAAGDSYLQAASYLFGMGDLDSSENAYASARRLSAGTEDEHRAWMGIITVLEGRGDVEKSQKEIREFLMSSPPVVLESRALLRLSRLHSMAGSVDKALETAFDGLRLVENTGEKAAIAMATSYLAFALSQKGRFDEARKYTEYGLKALKGLEDSYHLEAGLLHTLGVIESNLGSYKKAKRYYEESAAMYEDIGHLYNAAVARMNLALAYKSGGNVKQAYEHNMNAVRFFDKIGAKGPACMARYNTASVLMQAGDFDGALSILGEAESIAGELKSEALKGAVILTRGVCLVKMGKLDSGLREVEEGWEIRQKMGRAGDETGVVETRVEAALIREDFATALDKSKKILVKMRDNEQRDFYFKALEVRADALIAAGKMEDAVAVGAELEQTIAGHNNPYDIAQAKAVLARITAANGKITPATKLLEEAMTSRVLPREVVAKTLLVIANSLLDRGKLRKSAEFFAQAVKAYKPLVSKGFRSNELDYATEAISKIR